MYAVGRAFAAFNKWIHEDWGFSYKNRIFAAGYVTLADVDWALDQLDWMIERDVRAVNMRPSSVPDGRGGRRSLGDPAHDPFWKKMNQHGITLAMHSGDAGYEFLSDYWGSPPSSSRSARTHSSHCSPTRQSAMLWLR